MHTSLKKAGTLLLAGALALAGCQGEKGPEGMPGATGPAGTDGTNGTNGTNGTDGTNGTNGMNGVSGKLSLTIDSVVTAPVNGTNTSTLTFTIRPAAAVCPGGTCVDNLSILPQKTFYAQQYDAATNTFPTNRNFSFGGIHFKAITADGNGAQYTATKASPSFAPETSTSAFVYAYITNAAAVPAPTTGHYMLPSQVSSTAKVYGTIAYTSKAVVSGCEKCHGAPYSKHGYRQAKVAGLPDFASCKACHTDQRAGSDANWYMIADDPANYAASLDSKGALDATHAAKYAYTANIMNDVHNSHAFEFNYPQSISNCVTCHAGQLQNILTDANFKPTVCKSCHAVTGPTGGVEAGRAPAMKTIWANKGVASFHTMDLYAATAGGVDVDPAMCNKCHKGDGSSGKTFAQIHGGFSKRIYSAENARYADTLKVTVGTTSFDATANTLTVNFSIAGTAANALVKPTIVVSLYGYDSKDFVVSGHGSVATGLPGAGTSLLEYTDGATQRGNAALSSNSPRLTLNPAATTAGVTQWTATAILANDATNNINWGDLIANKTVKRVQVNILPAIGLDQTKKVDDNEYLTDTSGAVTGPNPAYNPSIGVTGASVAIDLATGAVIPAAAGTAIVDTAKCNACHDELGMTFHGPNYGSAGVVACRVCHFVGAGASHLEMQSRSIDSYVHAIHSMQAFDIKSIDLTDPVALLRYSDKVEGNYPNFAGTLNCDSCHNAGTYEVPDQAKSLPGLLSAASTFKAGTRTIGTVPAQISGPAERACGGCHRAQFINEDDAPSLAAFYAHTTANGTSVADTSATSLTNVTAYVLGQIGVIAPTAAITGAQVESCVVCHPTAGADHQNLFNTWKNGL
ncbi:multiheme c-type cytochrome [Anaeromyxobacter oryzae]|uniref:Surface localized decaheme cytochrome c lipoprotein n=1 Tax=Anaeromyxobacter oryzae TaxID=2918170 RepID=A0ABM7WUA7_9BACT|nr:hypothetical protein [Anaeromyxobacter oryzae]BDG03050.1 surface localized decaheme cytochrome c lipoprotein [Anaeromyxobacter oryzae]